MPANADGTNAVAARMAAASFIAYVSVVSRDEYGSPVKVEKCNVEVEAVVARHND
jgi:hypothetical protein